MRLIPLKEKYRGSGKAKNCGINGDHNQKSTRRKTGPQRTPHRHRTLVLGVDGMRRRWV